MASTTLLIVLGLLLCFVTVKSTEVHLDFQGLHLYAHNKPVPTYTFYKSQDKESGGTYSFSLLGVAEAHGDPLTIREDTIIEPKGWTLRETAENYFEFNYTAVNGTGNNGRGPHQDDTLAAVSLVTKMFEGETGDPIISIDIFFEGYSWKSQDADVVLVALFKLENTGNFSASLTVPERIQVGYSYFSVPQFAFSTLYENSVIQRVPARCYAPPYGQNFTYWVVYDRFSYDGGNLEHKISLGYGVPSRPDIAKITFGTSLGIIGLSFLVALLVLFGKKLENSRYGQRFEQITQ